MLFFLQLVTDADLLVPLILEARRRSDPPLRPRLVVDEGVLVKFPRLGPMLERRGLAFERVSLEQLRARSAPDLSKTAAVITATESSANPHEAARRLTRQARRLGKPTITLQHGYENVGLTWFDAIHTRANTRFLSDRILTWGPIELLHEDVRAETRIRCVPVGCMKELAPPRRALARPAGRPHFVAVFENLHWHRFDARFRARFLADLEQSALRFPDTTFFIRPHPAGRWLTVRHDGPRPVVGNLLIADPDDPAWDDWVGTEVLAIADGVITTPSTVALDAARCGNATAVVAYGQDVDRYVPLPALRSTADWMEFVRDVREPATRAALADHGRQFRERVTIAGDAAARALDVVVAEIGASRLARLGDRARLALARVSDTLHRGSHAAAAATPAAPATATAAASPAAESARPRVELAGETLVVVSCWDGRPTEQLVALLDAMAATPAGAPYRVRVVANRSKGGAPLLLPARHAAVELVERENVGFNIGAWEHGWRTPPVFSHYLFLQDECRIRRDGWLAPFRERLSDPAVGLVGERLNPPWNRPWPEIERRFAGHVLPDHLVDGVAAERMPAYHDFFRRHGVALGARGDHLQTLVLAARREVLEAIGGFPIGRNYGEAIAAEIAISKRVQALGLTIAEVGPTPFFCFEHPQWSAREQARAAAR